MRKPPLTRITTWACGCQAREIVLERSWVTLEVQTRTECWDFDFLEDTQAPPLEQLGFDFLAPKP